VQVKVSRDDYSGGMRVVAERVLDLAGARAEFGRRLLIRLNGVADADLLRVAIAPHADQPEAPLPVVIAYGNARGRCEVELGQRWRVRPREELIAEVRARLHPLDVVVEY